MKPNVALVALVALASGALVACGAPAYQARPGVLVPSPAMLYEGATGPLSYPSPTPRDVRAPPIAETDGKSCQFGLALPLFFVPPAGSLPTTIGAAWGDGGYQKAMAAAQDKVPGQRLFDVRADVHVISVLGLFRRECVEVHAAVAR